WPAATVVVPLAILWHRRAMAARLRRPAASPRLRRLSGAAWAALPLAVPVGPCGYVLAASLSRGPGWGGLAAWAVEAQALYWDTVQVPGSLLAFQLSPSWAFSNPEQPLALPALESWLYLWVGGVDERAAKIVAPLCLMALLAVLSAYLTRVLDAPRALSLACLLVLAPRLLELATTGYADVPLAAACGAAACYAARSVLNPDRRAENLASPLTP